MRKPLEPTADTGPFRKLPSVKDSVSHRYIISFGKSIGPHGGGLSKSIGTVALIDNARTADAELISGSDGAQAIHLHSRASIDVDDLGLASLGLEAGSE